MYSRAEINASIRNRISSYAERTTVSSIWNLSTRSFTFCLFFSRNRKRFDGGEFCSFPTFRMERLSLAVIHYLLPNIIDL